MLSFRQEQLLDLSGLEPASRKHGTSTLLPCYPTVTKDCYRVEGSVTCKFAISVVQNVTFASFGRSQSVKVFYSKNEFKSTITINIRYDLRILLTVPVPKSRLSVHQRFDQISSPQLFNLISGKVM